MLKVLTTVGTSLFINYLKVNTALANTYKNISDKPFCDWSKYIGLIEKFKGALPEFIAENRNASAEIKSLLAMQNEKKESIEVYLLCTDTIVSNLAAELLKMHLENSEISIIEKFNITGLDVSSKEKFETEGLPNLVNQIYELIKPKKDKDQNIIQEEWLINITGGYKGVIPYLTLIGQISNLEIFYIFEETDELIKIPQLPIQFDMNTAEETYFLLTDPFYWSEKKVAEMLYSLGFLVLQRNNPTYYCQTGLAMLFKQIVEDNTPFAKKILGFTIELKLYEYYLRNLPPGYHYVEHSSNYLNEGYQREQKGGEIDLVITKNECIKGDISPIIIEVKSAFQILSPKERETTLIQLEGKLKLLNEKQKSPHAIYYILYSFGKLMGKEYVARETGKLKVHCEKINHIIKEKLPNTTVKFYFLPIQLLPTRANPYARFMQKPIQKQSFNEIIF